MYLKSLTLAAVAAATLLMSTAWAPAQSAYSNAVANLNPPGYWPMHETTTAAAGDVETNYGTLGVLGNAYYPDYQVNSGAFIRQVSGPLGNGADTAVFFNQTNNNSGNITNSLIVPHTAPLATLQVPFSIELWYYVPTTALTNFEGDLISQCDSFRLSGFRVYYQNQGTGTNNPAQNGTTILFYNHTTANQGFQINWGAAVTNVWHHLVATVDTSSNVSTYLDGVLQAPANTGADPRQIPAGRYDPDFHQPLTIGNGLGNQRGFDGRLAEVAIYTNALSIVDIANHYAIGTNASAGATDYYNAVQADNPSIYLQMNSLPYTPPAQVTWPAVANDGTVGGNGVYTPGTLPGAVAGTSYGNYPYGLNGVNVALLSGMSSFADVGYANAYNPAGTTPFTVAALFRGNPTDTNRVQSIFGHGTNSWELGLTLNGSVVFNSGTNSTAVVATGTGAGDLVSQSNAYDDGNWHWVVASHNGSTNVLYLDGVANKTNVVVANSVGNTFDAMIGSDPCYTNNPIGWGRQFAGQVCDVVLLTNALTVGQVQSLYNVLGMPLGNLSQPVLSRVGSSDVFSVAPVTGSSPVYHWYFNTTSNYGGATMLTDGGGVSGSATPALNFVNLTDYYFVVATNGNSSLTSSIVQVPQVLTVASAGEPIWNPTGTTIIIQFSDVVDPATAATAGNYTLDNGASVLSAAVDASDAIGSKEVVLTTSALNTNLAYILTVQNVNNYYGVTQTPSPANLAVGVYPANLALWVNAGSGVTTNGVAPNSVTGWNDLSGLGNNLKQATLFNMLEPVLTNNVLGAPVVRFVVTNTGSLNYGSGLYANDAGSLEIVGDMSVIEVVSFSTPNFAAGQGQIIGKTGAVSPNQPAPYDYHVASTGPTVLRGSGSANGAYTASATVSTNQMHVVSFSQTGNLVSHYVDNRLAGTGTVGTFNMALCADQNQPLFVGNRGDYRQFNAEHLSGDLAALLVAGSAMSSNDIAALGNYLATGYDVPTGTNGYPAITQQPVASTNVYQTTTVTVPAAASGNPLAYQWYSTNGVAVAGQNTATLVINNVQTANGYYLVVTNIYGSAQSSNVVVNVIPVNTNPTNIVFSVTNNQMLLSWPADHKGWQLQGQTNSLAAGLGTNWAKLTSSTATNVVAVPINQTNGSVFWRLVFPPQ